MSLIFAPVTFYSLVSLMSVCTYLVLIYSSALNLYFLSDFLLPYEHSLLSLSMKVAGL